MHKAQTRHTTTWVKRLRGPWTVAVAAATVLLGPSAAVASALDRANAAPPIPWAVQAVPASGSTAAFTLATPVKRPTRA